MSDLVEFLRARLDEDESMLWRFSDWSKDRVLREVEAKWRIVTKHSGPDMWDSADYHLCYDEMTHNDDCETLQALAAVYADHPDYRDEWR